MKDGIPEKKAPFYMWIIGPLIFTFTLYYFARILNHLSGAFNFDDLGYSAFIFVLMLILFLLFVNYLLALSRMMIANRRAWAALMRQSFIYIGLLILGIMRIDVLNGDVFGLGFYPMLLCLLIMITVLISRPVRKYYTPIYAEELPLRSWMPLMVWIDPFHCEKIKPM